MIEDLFPPKEPPPIARHHCRHYSYERGLRGGPRCAVGINNSEPGGAAACMPPPVENGKTCQKREEWTEAERAASTAFTNNCLARICAIMAHIPSTGSGGTFMCPVCDGTVSWSRAGRNGHIHAHCSTPNCFSVMQ